MTTQEVPYMVRIGGVTHGYDTPGGLKVVLNGLNINIRKGEFVTLVGPSGCGKSTLLRLILGEERPLIGSVHVADKLKKKPGTDVGIVYQQYAVFPQLTAIQNIALGPILQETSTVQRWLEPVWPGQRAKIRKIWERAEQHLEMVKLGEAGDRYPHELSGGMRQRVAIAQALMTDPPVLLLDEPFSALDAYTREQLQLDLAVIWEETGMTVVMVTHELEEAIFMGTRFMVLSQHFMSEVKDGNGGAKVVFDVAIPEPTPRNKTFKEAPLLNEIHNRVLHDSAFQKQTDGGVVHTGNFILEHPDSVK
jgi:NitT/TauT family transport system ATP-binding protein